MSWTQDDAAEISADFWKAGEHVGEATLFINITKTTQPSYGDATVLEDVAKVAHVVVMSGPNKGDIYDDATIFGSFGKSLASSAPSAFWVGKVALGKAKPGRNAPYIPEDATDDEMREALNFLNENAEKGEDGMPTLDRSF